MTENKPRVIKIDMMQWWWDTWEERLRQFDRQELTAIKAMLSFSKETQKGLVELIDDAVKK